MDELTQHNEYDHWLLPPETLNEDISIKKISEAIRAQGNAWNGYTYVETPEEFIERRIIGKDKYGEEIYADYIKQFYVIRELNRLFGAKWWVENYKLWYEPTIQTYICTGELLVRTFDVVEKCWWDRRIPGTGAQQVLAKKDELRPSKPDDMAKSPRTDMIKNCAYWLGIGFDVYSREIPLRMRSQFEDMIRGWESTEWALMRAESLRKKDDFIVFMDNLPTQKDVERFRKLLAALNKPTLNDKLWNDFQKQNKTTIQGWLLNLETSINKQQNKGTNNE